LEEILRILEEEHVTASFFLVGRWADQNHDLVKKIHEGGHDFGNHGWSDPHMKDMAPEAIKDEIAKTNQIVEQLTPLDAVYDSVNKSVIPDLNGFEIDVAKTAERIRAAKKNANVIPIWSEPAPEKTLKDFANLPIYQGNSAKSQVALIVNVSWGNDYLEEILRILEEEHVTASFFLVGRWADQNHDLVKKIHEGFWSAPAVLPDYKMLLWHNPWIQSPRTWPATLP